MSSHSDCSAINALQTSVSWRRNERSALPRNSASSSSSQAMVCWRPAPTTASLSIKPDIVLLPAAASLDLAVSAAMLATIEHLAACFAVCGDGGAGSAAADSAKKTKQHARPINRRLGLVNFYPSSWKADAKVGLWPTVAEGSVAPQGPKRTSPLPPQAVSPVRHCPCRKSSV
jgi:hypothetical protein